MNPEVLSDILSGALGALCILVLIVSGIQILRNRRRPPRVDRAKVILKAGRAMLIRTGRRDWRNKPHYSVRFEIDGQNVDLLCPWEVYSVLEEGWEGEVTWKEGRVQQFHRKRS